MTAPITIDQLPGPHGVPLIGNLLELNTPNPMEKLIEWAGNTARSSGCRCRGTTG